MLGFDRSRVRVIAALSLFLALTLTAALLNFLSETVGEGAFVINLILTLLYAVGFAAMMATAGLLALRPLAVFGRVFAVISMVVFVFSAVATAAGLVVEGGLAVFVHAAVLLFAMPMYGLDLLIGSSIAVDCVSFLWMVLLCFVPEISVSVRASVRVRHELKK